MFGLGKDKDIFTKNITRKYKNARITIIDANYKKDSDNNEVMLDNENVDKLLGDINRAIENNESKYNPSGKRILIANNEKAMDEFIKSESNRELKETPLNDEFINIYNPEYSFDDVFISEKEKKQILNVLNIKKHENKLYSQWGFEGRSRFNRGVVLNFFGVPGTGKSMAAEAVAKYLGKKVYSINYADLESKYVGQTPKNVKKAFEAAKENNAVLVFEEADSFLGKRLTNISQSADYNINITRSVMLLELEKFEGIVIFTTNLLSNYDDAFKRRILCSVEFKMPDKEGRKEIFKIHIPKNMPLSDEVSVDTLGAEFIDITGADIKDIVFMAAVNALENEENKQGSEESDTEKDETINIKVTMDDFRTAYNDIKQRY